ncbi:MAG TPA: aminotransferase class III-fold pyridoxal phosphate-dependent enzyme [Noviherbaspirillum sp.]|jgi:glutamate-1-semialdehyde 2,1-aminomutase|uniref:aspartate aminotransferase family protein n=1 Tax=Noviherbaspirillum sp. TaxID=1926288 RepID=UPI002F949AC4
MQLDDALADARAAYIRRNPASREQLQEAARFLPGGNTRSALYYEPFPLTIARGQGAWLWDVDGHRYTDFLAEFTCGIYGHSNPLIRAALVEALDNGINLSGHNRHEARLAELVAGRFSLERVRFTNSGTEANLMAIAAAKAFTGRGAVLAFTGGYHGGVLTFATGNSRVNVPHRFILSRYNDLAAAEDLMREHGHDVAAVLVEPMQGAGGCIPGDAPFLHGLRQLCTRHGALLVLDEVMTSRLAPGGAQSLLALAPDLTTLGKYIGGGMSFGAFGGRGDVMALFDPGRSGALPHAGTFNNNVMTMCAGIAGLERLYTPQAAVALNARGDALRGRLNVMCAEAGTALQFTGLGSLMNLHPVAGAVRRTEDLAAAPTAVRDLFFFHMIARGFYLARRGMLALSLPLEDTDIDRFANAFADFLSTYRPLLGAGDARA